ncbi:MAG: ferritin-like domain-containing protein [Deltaproteobacteria bacterium]|nr:ferritin-like domain-containing protein [Deltaproteobacteria bacterium]
MEPSPEDDDLPSPEPTSPLVPAAFIVFFVSMGMLLYAASARSSAWFQVGSVLGLGSLVLSFIATVASSSGGFGGLFMGALVAGIQAVITLPLIAWAGLMSTPASPKGRLLRLRGRARLARLSFGGGWRPRPNEALQPKLPDSLAERVVAAEVWHLAARAEHASVPAFSKLSLQLIALGAPSELVEGAHRAALQEIDHARRCFALAQGYGGLPWDPGALPELADSLAAPPRRPDLVGLARGSLRDGCVGEGVAAAMAQALAQGAEDPVIAETLSGIAADEAEHAELSWAVVAWCLKAGGGPVREALLEEAKTLDDHRAAALPKEAPLSPARARALGLPDPALADTLSKAGVANVRSRLTAML